MRDAVLGGANTDHRFLEPVGAGLKAGGGGLKAGGACLKADGARIRAVATPFEGEEIAARRRRGRGATSNRSGRFEALARIDADDEWGALETLEFLGPGAKLAGQLGLGAVTDDDLRRSGG